MVLLTFLEILLSTAGIAASSSSLRVRFDDQVKKKRVEECIGEFQS